MYRPHCWPDGQKCPNDCAAQLHARIVSNQTPLYGPWLGWCMAGARLVSPHRDWITPHHSTAGYGGTVGCLINSSAGQLARSGRVDCQRCRPGCSFRE